MRISLDCGLLLLLFDLLCFPGMSNSEPSCFLTINLCIWTTMTKPNVHPQPAQWPIPFSINRDSLGPLISKTTKHNMHSSMTLIRLHDPKFMWRQVQPNGNTALQWKWQNLSQRASDHGQRNKHQKQCDASNSTIIHSFPLSKIALKCRFDSIKTSEQRLENSEVCTGQNLTEVLFGMPLISNRLCLLWYY